MPHSSGGGHSSHGSHGSSRSKPAEMRYGNRYYRGARRFVYYRGGAPMYYYSDRPYTLETAKSEKRKGILSNIITAIFGLIVAVSGLFSIPHKVTTDYDTAIIIRDTAQLLSKDGEAEMETAFADFRDRTGVTPAFFTISNTEFKERNISLSNYAYDLYVNTFSDEKHWLVVYCADRDVNEWAWEGMIGDDCGSIISTDLENEFTKTLQANLKRDPQRLSAAVADAFEKTGRNSAKLPPSVIFVVLFGAVFLAIAVKGFLDAIRKNPEDDPRLEATECPEAEREPETAVCAYCGGKYVTGLHTACPHCGAPIEEKWE